MALEVSQKFKGRKRLIFFKWFFLILIILAVSFVGSIYALGRAFRLNKIEVAGKTDNNAKKSRVGWYQMWGFGFSTPARILSLIIADCICR